MGAISNAINGLSYLTQPGGVLSNQAAPIINDLQTPQDVVTLSEAALQAQEVGGILGLPQQQNENTSTILPVFSTSTTEVLPGVAKADLTNATPQQQVEVNTQAVKLQEAQGLFGTNTNILG